MPLHIEQIADDLKAFLQTNLKAQLDTTLNEHSNAIPVSVPRPENYFVGERNQFIPYAAPSCFIIPSTTNEVTGQYEGESILKFEHAVFLSFLLEGTDVQNLNRAMYRLVQAATQCIRDHDITPDGITKRATVVHVPKIDYGRMFVSKAQQMFRRESWITLRIEHWDQRTTLPIEAGTGTQTVIVGAIGTGTTVVANTSESLVTTTSATNVLTYTLGSTGYNMALHVYYRVITSTTTVTIVLTYTDGTGAQSITMAAGAHGVNSYTLSPGLFFNAVGGAVVNVAVTASIASQVYVSAALEQL